MKLYSQEAEQHCLACALVDENAIPTLLEIPEDHFYRNEHKIIYRAIEELAQAQLTVDFFSVGELLQQKQQLTMCGGMEYLTELSESLPSLDMFRSFANSLLTHYKMRQLVQIKDSLEQQIQTGAKPTESVEWLQGAVIDLLTDHHKGGFKGVGDYLNEVIDEMEWREQNKGRLLGQQSGFGDLDFTLDGFQDGRVYVIAGRPGSGKTAFALALANGLTENQKPWFYFSLEMTGKSLAKRLMLSLAKVSNMSFRMGNIDQGGYNRIGGAIGQLQDRTLHVDQTPSLTVSKIRSRLKASQMKFGQVGGIIIDHIGLVKKDAKKTDTEGMNMIADGLLELAKEFDCPMIELCQLNRGVEGRTDKRPMLSDLKQSGKIEENADVVMLLYRGDYYDREAEPVTEVDVAKSRDGEVKTHYFKHDLSIGQYEPLEGYKPEKPEQKAKF